MAANEQAHRIYEQWDRYARSGEIDAPLGLYASDATFESPLVPC